MIELKIIGRLGSDATAKVVNGQTVLNFSVVHSHTYKDSNGNKVESPTWVRCDMWVKKDALSQYLTKCTMVYCSGFPRVYAWQREDRTVAGTLQMRVTDLQLLGGSRKNIEEETPAVAPPEETVTGIADDLPF